MLTSGRLVMYFLGARIAMDVWKLWKMCWNGKGGKIAGGAEGEEGAGKGGSSSVPAEERRVVFRSSIESSSSLLFEVCACLFRRTHPLAEVAVE